MPFDDVNVPTESDAKAASTTKPRYAFQIHNDGKKKCARWAALAYTSKNDPAEQLGWFANAVPKHKTNARLVHRRDGRCCIVAGGIGVRASVVPKQGDFVHVYYTSGQHRTFISDTVIRVHSRTKDGRQFAKGMQRIVRPAHRQIQKNIANSKKLVNAAKRTAVKVQAEKDKKINWSVIMCMCLYCIVPVYTNICMSWLSVIKELYVRRHVHSRSTFIEIAIWVSLLRAMMVTVVK